MINDDTDSVGVITGLWANSIRTRWNTYTIEAKILAFWSTFLDLKLTGMQGDVMKESMNVAQKH